MFNVYVHDGINIPSDEICYIVAKEGIFLKKRVGVMESIAPVKNISVLPSISATAKMHIPKIPGNAIAKIANFFKAVYDKYQSESIVLLFYSEETKKYKIVPPKQEVSGAAVDYTKGMQIEGMIMVGTIHSHANFSAFHSGVDDNDEKFFDGIHITIGHVNAQYPSISCSIVSNGYRVQVNAEEYISNIIVNPEIKEEITPQYKTYKYENGQLVEVIGNKTTTTLNRLDRRFILNVPEHKRQFNPDWMKVVSKKTYSYSYGGYSGLYGHGYNPQKDWGANYDKHFWDDWHDFLKSRNKAALHDPTTTTQQPVQPASSPYNVGPVKNGIEFPKHENVSVTAQPSAATNPEKPTDIPHPCLKCQFRDYRIEELLEMLEEEEENEGVFQCANCKTIIEEDKDDLTCPNCKTDKYLELIEIIKEPKNTPPALIQQPQQQTFQFSQLAQEEKPVYYKCPTCGNSFYKTKSDEVCPFCYTDIKFETEDYLEKQAVADSAGNITEEDVNKLALIQAAKEEETPIPLPEPGTDPTKIIPLKERIMSMFKKTLKDEGRC